MPSDDICHINCFYELYLLPVVLRLSIKYFHIDWFLLEKFYIFNFTVRHTTEGAEADGQLDVRLSRLHILTILRQAARRARHRQGQRGEL